MFGKKNKSARSFSYRKEYDKDEQEWVVYEQLKEGNKLIEETFYGRYETVDQADRAIRDQIRMNNLLKGE